MRTVGPRPYRKDPKVPEIPSWGVTSARWRYVLDRVGPWAQERETVMQVVPGTSGDSTWSGERKHGRWLGCVPSHSAIHLGSGEQWRHSSFNTNRYS